MSGQVHGRFSIMKPITQRDIVIKQGIITRESYVMVTISHLYFRY